MKLGLMEKYGKKKVYIGVAIAIIVASAIGIGGTVAYANNKKQSILNSIYINFVNELTIEYGTETVDYQAFIESSVGEVTLPTESIDTKEVGTKELIYKVSQQGYEKEQKVTVEVKDTQAPIITFKEDTITIEVGAEFDLKSNIESVLDPVDGVIEDYEVIHDLDNNTVGEYTVTIKATDKNNNVTEKSYTVVVKEVEQPTSNTASSSTGNYRPTTPNYSTSTPSYSGSNNNSSNNSSNNNCTVHPNQIGNSGKLFNTMAEARAWGESQVLDKNSPYYMMAYSYGAVHNECGIIVGYTVHFK